MEAERFCCARECSVGRHEPQSMRARDADVESVQRAERSLEPADQLSSTDEVLRFDCQSPVHALFEVALELTRDTPGVVPVEGAEHTRIEVDQ